MRFLAASALLAALITGCGTDGPEYGDQGLAGGGGATGDFIRASQLFFRGNLSDAREILTGFEERHPDSPLADDASLALRRIEADLSGASPADSAVEEAGRGRVTLISRPALAGKADAIARALSEEGYATGCAQDQGAPEITVVLFTEGHAETAQRLTADLEELLARPQSVAAQPAGELAEMVAPGFEGVMLVVGDDAALQRTGPGASQ
jgi:hypothetical protein